MRHHTLLLALFVSCGGAPYEDYELPPEDLASLVYLSTWKRSDLPLKVSFAPEVEQQTRTASALINETVGLELLKVAKQGVIRVHVNQEFKNHGMCYPHVGDDEYLTGADIVLPPDTLKSSVILAAHELVHALGVDHLPEDACGARLLMCPTVSSRAHMSSAVFDLLHMYYGK